MVGVAKLDIVDGETPEADGVDAEIDMDEVRRLTRELPVVDAADELCEAREVVRDGVLESLILDQFGGGHPLAQSDDRADFVLELRLVVVRLGAVLLLDEPVCDVEESPLAVAVDEGGRDGRESLDELESPDARVPAIAAAVTRRPCDRRSSLPVPSLPSL